MSQQGFALFDTLIGRCGIAWSERGVIGLQLPEIRDAKTRERMQHRFPKATEAAPPPEVVSAIQAIEALLTGTGTEVDNVALDMERVPPFHRRVYEAARAIAPGTTLSYGEIATKIGAPGSARAVGQALGKNPFAIIVPCHRVLAANGKMGGFSATGGIVTKLKLLSLEGAHVGGQGTLFEGDGVFGFDPNVAVAHLRDVDPIFGRLMDKVGPFRMRLKRARSIFSALAESIAYQQLTGRAAATIFARVSALFPRPHEGPTPELLLRMSDAKLRAAGLSGAKLLSLKDLARKTVDGTVPTLAEAHRMNDETLIERLTQVRGIGRWTVEMLLMFRLGRPDILPVDDLGIRKGYAVAYRKRAMPTTKDLAKYGLKWRPYRTVASWYLWRATELGKAQ